MSIIYSNKSKRKVFSSKEKFSLYIGSQQHRGTWPPLLPEGGFGHLPSHPAASLRSLLTTQGLQPSFFRRKGPSLQLSTHISCSHPSQQIKLKTLPTSPVMLSCLMPYPMDMHQSCPRVLMAAMQLWHQFFPKKPMQCEGCITNTWILPTEESRTRASIEKWGPFLFCQLTAMRYGVKESSSTTIGYSWANTFLLLFAK